MIHEEYVKSIKNILDLLDKEEYNLNDKSKILSQINRLVQDRIHQTRDDIEDKLK